MLQKYSVAESLISRGAEEAHCGTNAEPTIAPVNSDQPDPAESSSSVELTAAAKIARIEGFNRDDFRKFLNHENPFHWTRHRFVVKKLVSPTRGLPQIYVLNVEVPAIIEGYQVAMTKKAAYNADRRRRDIDQFLENYSHDELIEIYSQLKSYFRRQSRYARSVNSIVKD